MSAAAQPPAKRRRLTSSGASTAPSSPGRSRRSQQQQQPPPQPPQQSSSPPAPIQQMHSNSSAARLVCDKAPSSADQPVGVLLDQLLVLDAVRKTSISAESPSSLASAAVLPKAEPLIQQLPGAQSVWAFEGPRFRDHLNPTRAEAKSPVATQSDDTPGPRVSQRNPVRGSPSSTSQGHVATTKLPLVRSAVGQPAGASSAGLDRFSYSPPQLLHIQYPQLLRPGKIPLQALKDLGVEVRLCSCGPATGSSSTSYPSSSSSVVVSASHPNRRQHPLLDVPVCAVCRGLVDPAALRFQDACSSKCAILPSLGGSLPEALFELASVGGDRRKVPHIPLPLPVALQPQQPPSSLAAASSSTFPEGKKQVVPRAVTVPPWMFSQPLMARLKPCASQARLLFKVRTNIQTRQIEGIQLVLGGANADLREHQPGSGKQLQPSSGSSPMIRGSSVASPRKCLPPELPSANHQRYLGQGGIAFRLDYTSKPAGFQVVPVPTPQPTVGSDPTFTMPVVELLQAHQEAHRDLSQPPRRFSGAELRRLHDIVPLSMEAQLLQKIPTSLTGTGEPSSGHSSAPSSAVAPEASSQEASSSPSSSSGSSSDPTVESDPAVSVGLTAADDSFVLPRYSLLGMVLDSLDFSNPASGIIPTTSDSGSSSNSSHEASSTSFEGDPQRAGATASLCQDPEALLREDMFNYALIPLRWPAPPIRRIDRR